MSKPRKPKCSSLRCEVCRSLKIDSAEWRSTAGGGLQRGAIRVYPESGEIEQDGATVPLSWLERRCVRKACRFRAEKRFAVYKFVPSEK